MKKLALILLLFFFGFPSFADNGKGSFIVLQPTNLYKTSKMKERVLRTNLRSSYAVHRFGVDRKEKLVKLQIAFPSIKRRNEQVGFAIMDEEITDDEKFIKVFKTIPKGNKQKIDFLTIPIASIVSKTLTEKSDNSTEAIWNKVTYKASENDYYWVYSNSGIYRADLGYDELNELYQKVQNQKFSYSRTVLILSGYVNKGSTKNWVELALGKPVNIMQKENNLEEWSYVNQKIYFKKNRVDLIVYDKK